jgi:hypothetical protein
MVFTGLLNILSCIYLAFVVTFILGLNEADDWRTIWGSTARRWAKFMLAFLAIALGVLLLGS